MPTRDTPAPKVRLHTTTATQAVVPVLVQVNPPTPTCPWPTEGEAWVWDCHHKKGADMTPYRDRMNQGHYGTPVASTTSKDVTGITKTAKAKPKTRSSKRSA